tara:strand:- start:308 stop:421 length:114 start_codon:yes stop_codon:yes gene_type:complete
MEGRLIIYLFYEPGGALLIAIGIMNLTAYPRDTKISD